MSLPIFIIISACSPLYSITPETETSVFASPNIDDITLSCLEDEWTLKITASAWTGNGRWWLGTTEHNIEEHPIYSISAAADGSSDTLRSILSSVPDWRDAQSGTYTRWYCNDIDEISIAVSIFEGERGLSNEVADCVEIGEDLWNIPRAGGRIPDGCQIREDWITPED